MASIGGISYQSQIDQLMQYYRYLEEEPIRRLEDQKSTLNSKLDIYNSLSTKLSSFKTVITDFTGVGSLSPLQEKTVEYSIENIVSVEANRSAQPSNYAIKVNQLAKYDTVISDQITLSDTTLASSLGAGTHSFTIGYGTTSKTISITVDAADTNEDIMNKIIDEINNQSNFEVTASLVNDTDTTGRINITATQTGSDHRLTITDGTTNLASSLGLDTSVKASGTSGGYLYDLTELDAQFDLNGISITRSSNVLDDVISGATLTLVNTQAASDAPVSVTISNDTTKVRENIQNLIDKFNAVIDYINSKSKIDTTNYSRGPLVGDIIAQKVKTKLRELFTSEVTTASSNGPSYLFEIGITFNRDGKLEISDSDKLDQALENNLSGVETLFHSSDGIATRIKSWLDDYLGSDGSIASKKESLNSQIRYIDHRIDSLQKSIDKKMDYYLKQFSELQSAMAAAQTQLANMTQINTLLYA
jgi:flagellar hook-associated protein 2